MSRLCASGSSGGIPRQGDLPPVVARSRGSHCRHLCRSRGMLWRGRLVGAWLQPSESVGSAAVDLPTRRSAAILSALAMRLVMTLLVRNEQDIVAANLDYHL